MNSLFHYDNPIFQSLGRIVDLVLLNFLFLLCCIPIITIGPSITALYYCMLKISRDQDSSMIKMFFHSFRDNLKQGIILTIFFLVFALFIVVDLYACNTFPALRYIKIFIYTLVLIFVVIVSYAFPLLAQFHNSIGNILKNSLFMAISNFHYTIVIVLMNILPFLILYFSLNYFVLVLPILSICGTALTAFINSKLFIKIFDQYIS